MKLRENFTEYRVRCHGSEYVDPDKPHPGICPECQSSSVKASTDDDFTSADWICTSCGCKFDSYTVSKRTELGNILSTILLFVIVLLIVAMGVCTAAGLIWFGHKKQELGGIEAVPDAIRWKAIAVCLGGPTVCGILMGIVSSIEHKI